MAFHFVTAVAAALALAGQEPEPVEDACANFLVFFAEGSARLDRSAMGILDNWAVMARPLEAPFTRYVIEARADATGDAAANLDLSWRRGRAIVRYLIGRGFPAERFRVRAQGESEPLWFPPGTPPDEARALNRAASPIMATRPSHWRLVYGNLLC